MDILNIFKNEYDNTFLDPDLVEDDDEEFYDEEFDVSDLEDADYWDNY